MSPADPIAGFVHRFVPGRPGDPTLLLLHGTGGDENDLLPLGPMVMPGATLLSPRGKVLENGMPRFFRRFAEGVFDLEDLRARTTELAGFVKDACAAHSLDASNVIAVGFSNGANIAASLLLLEPGVLRGAVLFRATLPIVPEQTPALAGTPVMISAGGNDPVTHPEDVERLAALLRAAGAEVSLVWDEGGHTLGSQQVAHAREWLQALPARS
jgi:predicted esterase